MLVILLDFETLKRFVEAALRAASTKKLLTILGRS